MPTTMTLQASTVGLATACALTLLVLASVTSTRIARLAQTLLVGTTAGYVAAMVWKHILITRLVLFVQKPGEYWYYGLFLLLGLLLFFRRSPRFSQLAGVPLTLLMGTGIGLALAGAISGTLLPQTLASIESLSPAAHGSGLPGLSFALDACIMILCTVSVLAAFRYLKLHGRGAIRAMEGVSRTLCVIGQAVIAIVMGALLTGAVMTFYTLLVDRLEFVIASIPQIIQQVRL